MIRFIFWLYLFISVAGCKPSDYIVDSNMTPYPDSDRVLDPDLFITIPTYALNSSFFDLGGLLTLSSATDPGNILFFGVQRLEAFRGIIKDLNALGNGFLNGTTIVYTVFDTEDTSATALPAAMQLLFDNIIATVGPTGTDQTYTTASFLRNYNVTVISHAATASELANVGLYPFARTIPSDSVVIDAMIALCLRLNWTLIMPLFTNDTYGTSGRSQFITAAAQNNITLECMNSVSYITGIFDEDGDMTTLADVSQCIAESQSNVALLYMTLENAQNTIRVLNQNPANQRLTFLAPAWTTFFNDPLVFTNGEFPVSYLEGTIGVIPVHGNTTAFTNYFYGLNPENNNYPLFIEYWQTAFRCFYNSTDMSIPLCVPNISLRTYPLACRCDGTESTSELSIDEKVCYVQDAVLAIIFALDRIIRNCSSIPFGDYCSKASISGSELFDVIVAFPFEGYTGRVAFNGTDRADPMIEILQSNAYGVPTRVGTFSYESFELQESLLAFKSSGTPVSAIVPDNPTLRTPIGLIISIQALLLAMFSGLFMVIFYRYRMTKVIRNASPVFCELMLIGIIMICVGLILWTIEQSTMLCITKAWFTVCGFGLIIGSLLAKTYRIFRIFSNVRVVTLSVRNRDLLRFTGIILLIEVILLCVYTFADGLPSPHFTVSDVNEYYGYIVCRTNSTTFEVYIISLIICFNVILIFATAMFGYLTRNVSSDYNESRYIAAIVYGYALLLVIGIPIYFTDIDRDGFAKRQYIARSVCTLIGMSFTLLVLFVPKLRELGPRFRERSIIQSLPRTTDSFTIADTVPYTMMRSNMSQQSDRPPKFLTETFWKKSTVSMKRNSALQRMAVEHGPSSSYYYLRGPEHFTDLTSLETDEIIADSGYRGNSEPSVS